MEVFREYAAEELGVADKMAENVKPTWQRKASTRTHYSYAQGFLYRGSASTSSTLSISESRRRYWGTYFMRRETSCVSVGL